MSWLSPLPEMCDLCKAPFDEGHQFIDGKTFYGPWALMCVACHKWEGVGLGTGKGQRYDWSTREKLEG